MSNQKQIQADYAAAKAEARTQLAAVCEMINNHLKRTGARTIMLDYGHVGDMNHVAAKLRELATDSNH